MQWGKMNNYSQLLYFIILSKIDKNGCKQMNIIIHIMGGIDMPHLPNVLGIEFVPREKMFESRTKYQGYHVAQRGSQNLLISSFCEPNIYCFLD